MIDPEIAFYIVLILIFAGLFLALIVRRSLLPGTTRELATGVVVVVSSLILLVVWQHYAVPSDRSLANASSAASPCKGRLPAPGVKFRGEVRYVDDGDSICVGASGSPNSWVEVRLDDFDAPGLQSPGGQDAKAALEDVALGRSTQCVASKRFGDHVMAHCILIGNSIGYLMHRAGIQEGGRQR